MELFLAGSSADDVVKLIDFRTGAVLTNFKGGTVRNNGLCVVGMESFYGLFNAHNGIGAWSFSKEMMATRSGVPENMTCLTSSPDGQFVAGGGKSGTVFVWHADSGVLLKQWEAHFRETTSVVFTDDSSSIITASADSTISVWPIASVLNAVPNAKVTSSRVFDGHALSVCGLAVGAGGSSPHIFSVGVDRSLRVWSLLSTTAVATITLPATPTTVCVDSPASTVYVGTSSGSVLRIPVASVMAASYGKPSGSDIKFEDLAFTTIYQGHKGSVNTICGSFDGTVVVSGGADGAVLSWDVSSSQCVRRAKLGTSLNPFPVSALVRVLRPPALHHSSVALRPPPARLAKFPPPAVKPCGLASTKYVGALIPTRLGFSMDNEGNSSLRNSTAPWSQGVPQVSGTAGIHLSSQATMGSIENLTHIGNVPELAGRLQQGRAATPEEEEEESMESPAFVMGA